MSTADGRLTIAFNGEIYNHNDIRRELESQGPTAWKGSSDTETLLHAISTLGTEAALNRTVGMFAFALWDEGTQTLTLARDRFGEKPLYYGWVGGNFVFGSELKALRAFEGFDNSICREALAQYLNLAYVPCPRSIYQGIYKLEPGCILTVRGTPPPTAPRVPPSVGGRGHTQYQNLEIRRWYSAVDAASAGSAALINDETAAVNRLDEQLKAAVSAQMISDVPLGAFLSGGVDSSAIVALMQAASSRPVKTFTVGFESAGFDESPHARAVAEHLGTDHHEMFVTAAEARDLIPNLATMFCEPFGDSSQIPTHLVCKAAKQQVTVALSGDAGDELFGGYNRYFWGPRIWAKAAKLPYPAREMLARFIHTMPPKTWDRLVGHGRVARPGEKLHKLAAALEGARSIDDLYNNLVAIWPFGTPLVRGAGDDALTWRPSQSPLPKQGIENAAERMMLWDVQSYMTDDILVKVDRAAMATSLETRAPFLDHRVAELAWRLPLEMKVRGGEGKWALRQVLYRYVPRELIERPKAGFAIPIGEWLRGPLREWAEDLLDEGRLRREGYLEPAPIRKAWAEHLSSRYDWTARLWTVLMFQAWLGEWG